MTRTAAAADTGLPSARRTFLGQLAALPLIGSMGFPFFARRADAATIAISRQIDDAERRCRESRQAFDDAAAIYEATLPRLHPSLIGWPAGDAGGFRTMLETRVFDNKIVKRGPVMFGVKQSRNVVTTGTLEKELARCPDWNVSKRRAIGRYARRAERYEAALRQHEEACRLSAHGRTFQNAKRDLEELADAVFASPATSRATIAVQARMLTVYVQAIGEQYAAFQAGRWGAQLAQALQQIEHAA